MHKLPKELGQMMRKWRMDQGKTVDQAAEAISVSKSTWSDLENSKRPISIETAKGLSLATGVSLDEIARMSGQPMRRSSSSQERLQRADAAAAVIPGLGHLMDLFPELLPDEVDMLLSSAESLIRRRTKPE